MDAELESLQAGGKKRAVTLPKGLIVASIWKRWQSIWAFGELKKRCIIQRSCAGMLHRVFKVQTLPELMPGKEQGEQRNPAIWNGLPATPCVDLAGLPDARSEGGSLGKT